MSLRRRGAGRRGLASVRWALVLSVLLSGCATLPESAPVEPTASPSLTASLAPTASVAPTEALPAAAAAFSAGSQAVVAQWPVGSEQLVGDNLRRETQRLLVRGEYDALLPLLEEARQDPTQSANAVDLCRATAYLADGDLNSAVDLLLPWAEHQGPLQHQTLAMLGEAYERAGQWLPAATTYDLLLALDPPARGQVAWRAARARVQVGDSAAALRLLQGIDTAEFPASFRAEVLEERARLARESSQWEESLAALDEILTFAVQPGYRMLVEVERAHTLLSISDYDAAIPILQEAMAAYPDQAAGQLALALLKPLAEEDPKIEAAQIDPLVEARVNYYAGLYDQAAAGVTKALKTRSADRAEAYALRGLIAARSGSVKEALAALDKAITLYSQRTVGDEAVLRGRIAEVWFTKAQLVEGNGGDPAKVYTQFVARYPDFAQAPQALWLAAAYEADRAIGANSAPEPDAAGSAAELYTRVAREYPQSSYAQDASLRAGLVWYRQGEVEQAQAVWADELARLSTTSAPATATPSTEVVDVPTVTPWPRTATPAPTVQYSGPSLTPPAAPESLPTATPATTPTVTLAEAQEREPLAEELVATVAEADVSRVASLQLWLGLLAKARGELDTAEAQWAEAAALDPEGYYGLRAADLLAGASLTLPADSTALAEDATADWGAIAAWADSWAAPTDPAESQAELSAGLWLWRVGWTGEALTVLRGLAMAHSDDAALLATLGRDAQAAGIWAVSTMAAEYLLAAGRDQAVEMPADVWRAAYPLAYADLVQENAAAYGLDPLLFTALLRQESRFYPRANSSAGARGLAQVVPSTGAWIAEKVGTEAYRDELLYRPCLSIRYGAWYLDYTLSLCDREWPLALAAYNGGPGNLARWTEGKDEVDYDLLAETIPASETRWYVKTVYAQYRLYQQIYR